MSIKHLKQNVQNLPRLAEVDEEIDPLILAHYSTEYFGIEFPEPIKMDWWIIAGQEVTYRTTDGGTFKDFRCFGIAEIFEKEMGEFDLLCDIRRYGGMLDKDWKPIKLSEFKWD